MISSYIGCRLANATRFPTKELVYSFPIDVPMSVLHIGGYTVGANINFAGDKGFLITTCGMSTFSVAEPVTNPSAMVYTQALLTIMLRFGLAHTIVIDADKKFYNTFRQMCKLLHLNVHTVSGENHDLMLVERVKLYLNKGLTIFTQERGTPAISREAAFP